MKMWIMSDLHDDRGLVDVKWPGDFDVLVCAGDMMTGDIEGSIERAAAMARGRKAVLVAGNHEWMTSTAHETLELGRAAAARNGVRFLEQDTTVIDGVIFAGATLWPPDDSRFAVSAMALKVAKADVVVTHFPPDDRTFKTVLLPGKVWICGHHHGFEYRTGPDARRLVRNAVGYGPLEQLVDSEPALADFMIEIEP